MFVEPLSCIAPDEVIEPIVVQVTGPVIQDSLRHPVGPVALADKNIADLVRIEGIKNLVCRLFPLGDKPALGKKDVADIFAEEGLRRPTSTVASAVDREASDPFEVLNELRTVLCAVLRSLPVPYIVLSAQLRMRRGGKGTVMGHSGHNLMLRSAAETASCTSVVS